MFDWIFFVVSHLLGKFPKDWTVANKFTQQGQVEYSDSKVGQADIRDIEFRVFALMGISCSGLKRRTADGRTVEQIDEVTDSVLKLFN